MPVAGVGANFPDHTHIDNLDLCYSCPCGDYIEPLRAVAMCRADARVVCALSFEIFLPSLRVNVWTSAAEAASSSRLRGA